MPNSTKKTKNIYTIPAGIAFSKSLATEILKETNNTPEKLPKYRILLPTRRACRVLKDSFLQLTDGKPLLLPQLQSIGDVNSEELSFHVTDKSGLHDFINLPAAIPPIKRQLMLAKTIQTAQKQNKHMQNTLSFSHAMALAKALGTFMDQIYTEDLALKDLATLVPEEFANHWQLTLDFLKILSEHWPKILEENKVIDIAQRRNILIKTLSNHWNIMQPTTPIIAAGTTGSIPAVATLLNTIKTLPQGRIVLPGFDKDIEDADWDALDETHPQFGFKHLLERLNTPKDDIQIWPCAETAHNTNTIQNRQHLTREIMRPASTTIKWTNIAENFDLKSKLKQATQGIEYYECNTAQEEATLIALIMRETLEHPTKTAALITPDRNLARRVTMICKRWNIEIDDSAGLDLSGTTIGLFMRGALDALGKNLPPVAFLSLLKQNIQGQDKTHTLENTLAHLEIHALRGLKPNANIEGITENIERTIHNHTSKDIQKDLSESKKLCVQLKPILDNFYNNIKENKDLESLIRAHIKFCENLFKITHIDTAHLWSEQEGDAAATLISELLDHSRLISNISIEDYAETFGQLLKTVTIRAPYGTHPRLKILGQLEARMMDCDHLILSGLNEGTWPSDAGHDPWMSRPMRKEFGLPSFERATGLAAHDFAQGLCQPRVTLTRSKSMSGAPTVPSRWLQRLDTILQSCDTNIHSLNTGPYLEWARQIDTPQHQIPAQRPAPTPPHHARPTKLSITKIETWLKDPYSIYAAHILKLRPLDPLEKHPGAAERGTLLHSILDQFIRIHKEELNNNGITILSNIAQKEITKMSLPQDNIEFWWPRFNGTAAWFIDHEKHWRTQAKPLKTEAYGELDITTKLTTLTLTGRADRIDRLHDNTYAIIDYKTGGTYSKKNIITGNTPQLALEALILQNGGFQDIPPYHVSHLSYWTMTGGKTPGKSLILNHDIAELIKNTQERLTDLINEFANDTTPYYAIPNLENAPRFNDYEHLARIQEWASLDLNTTEAG